MDIGDLKILIDGMPIDIPVHRECDSSAGYGDSIEVTKIELVCDAKGKRLVIKN